MVVGIRCFNMDTVMALLLLLLSSSSCSTISRKEELGLNKDFVISKIADHIIIKKPDEINETPFDKLRRYLKVVPFKDGKNWDGDSVSKHENNVPIAVILAQKLKDNNGHEESGNLESLRNPVNENKLDNNLTSVTEVPIAENRLDVTESVESKAFKDTGITSDILEDKPLVKSEFNSELFQDNDILKSIERPKELIFENYDRTFNGITDFDSKISQTNEMNPISKEITNNNCLNKEFHTEENAKVNDFDIQNNDSFKSSNDLVEKDNDEYKDNEISQNRKKCLIIKEYSFTGDGLNHNHYSLNFVFNN